MSLLDTENQSTPDKIIFSVENIKLKWKYWNFKKAREKDALSRRQYIRATDHGLQTLSASEIEYFQDKPVTIAVSCSS